MKALSSRSRTLIVCALLAAAGGGTWLVLNRGNSSGKPDQVSRLENLVPGDIGLEQRSLVREELRELLDSQTPHRRRIDILRSLEGALSPEECQGLLHALSEPRLAVESEEQHAEYVQQVCLVLRDQREAREDYARVLATLARDGRRDKIVRDYALQHLRMVWDRAEGPLRAAVEETFKEVVRDGGELAAPALLSLHLLGTPTGPIAGEDGVRAPVALASMARRSSVAGPTFHVSDSFLEPLAREILASQPTAESLAQRMTAIRIVADRKLPSLKPELGRILSDKEREHSLVRMSAVAAISRFGDPADRALLESTDRSDPRIDRAVNLALSQIH